MQDNKVNTPIVHSKQRGESQEEEDERSRAREGTLKASRSGSKLVKSLWASRSYSLSAVKFFSGTRNLSTSRDRGGQRGKRKRKFAGARQYKGRGPAQKEEEKRAQARRP